VALNIFQRNRGFQARIRNEAYVRARERFRATVASLPAGDDMDRDHLKNLDELVAELETSYEYASNAIRGLRRGRLKRYRNDHDFGVLEEEVVLQHFLEEMITQARFLRKRFETDIKIRLYRERVRRLQSQSPDGDGFLQGVLDSLGELVQGESSDLKRILDLMDRRYQVGDRLMDILRSKAPKLLSETAPLSG
jgi:hypothetical protein